MKGSKIMRKKTNEEFLEELKHKRPNITALEEYVSALNPIKFKCNECNYEWSATPANVLYHTECPNFRNHNNYVNHNYIDLVGKVYDNLTVIERVDDYISPSGNKSVRWKCQCKCGNITYRTTSWLNSAKNQSCGCLKSQLTIERCMDNLVGQKYGKLTVVKYAGSHKDGSMWECRCDCVKTIIVQARFLKRGSVKSCGCLQSMGEEIIANFLDRNNIKYIRQKKFDNLVGLGNGKLRFDFYIDDKKVLLEYNGRQHYMPVDFKGEGQEIALAKFKNQQIYDDLKRTFANENNYDLIEIPYWEENNIEIILTEKLLSKEVV